MTLLIFEIREVGVQIAADTLVTDAQGQPVTNVRKIHELEGGICAVATGMANILIQWVAQVSEDPPADLQTLAAVAPASLAQIAEQQSAEHGVRVWANLYLFGPDGDTYAGFVFRHENGYEAEPLGYQFGVKPPIAAVIAGALRSTPDDWIRLAVQLKAHEDASTAPDRVPIGGQLDMAWLEDGTAETRTVYNLG